MPTQPAIAGPAAIASCCGSCGRVSPRLTPSRSSIRLCASVSTGSWAFSELEDAATAAFASAVVVISRRATAGRSTGRRAASAGASSPAARAIAVTRRRERQPRPPGPRSRRREGRTARVPCRAAPRSRRAPARESLTQDGCLGGGGRSVEQPDRHGGPRRVSADPDRARGRRPPRARRRARAAPSPATAIDGVAPSRPRVSRTSPTTCPIPTPERH